MNKILLLCILITACNSNHQLADVEQAKKEIRSTEKAFARLCKDKGVEIAFITFAADSAVIHRDNKILKGKEEIKGFYKNRFKKGETLDWTPDFVEVSSSADLGYTYGHYVFSSTDSLGNKHEVKGIFHTVWKKQMDGNWKFVWD